MLQKKKKKYYYSMSALIIDFLSLDSIPITDITI